MYKARTLVEGWDLLGLPCANNYASRSVHLALSIVHIKLGHLIVKAG